VDVLFHCRIECESVKSTDSTIAVRSGEVNSPSYDQLFLSVAFSSAEACYFSPVSSSFAEASCAAADDKNGYRKHARLPIPPGPQTSNSSH
jgi:hypothetical protein